MRGLYVYKLETLRALADEDYTRVKFRSVGKWGRLLKKSLIHLRQAGYKLVYVSDTNMEYTFIKQIKYDYETKNKKYI